MVDPLLHERNYAYDASNRLITIQDPDGNISTTNQYDSSGRVTRQTLADGNTFQFAYTVVNESVTQTEVTDQRGKVRHIELNPAGYIARSVAAFGTPSAQETTFSLDGNGQILTVTDPMGRVRGFTYDSFGNRLSVTRLQGTPNAVTTSYAYTVDGAHLLTITDPLSIQTGAVSQNDEYRNSHRQCRRIYVGTRVALGSYGLHVFSHAQYSHRLQQCTLCGACKRIDRKKRAY